MEAAWRMASGTGGSSQQYVDGLSCPVAAAGGQPRRAGGLVQTCQRCPKPFVGGRRRGRPARRGALIAAADAAIERLRAGDHMGGRLLTGSPRGSKSLAKGLELTGQRRQAAAMIGVLDCLGRDQQIVRPGAVCAF